ncbi:hypothetical protein MGYG_04795 [Nannizzia gypsea CBS 118893]|uniref:Uncharacterized protein n=1 Tax=Arthroderma gypseum (strain ATCC MYA-4604 / CBS 118893) TaxID=535722 RepID=E4UWU1_ARTGP|nr:hypothetical protein MGYG_04795 [Nannizzia gypsea CBS 118893]EFR01794.1 hypothetical protein MGYG_04795 [Nannizzia gypsea CBS 118893]
MIIASRRNLHDVSMRRAPATLSSGSLRVPLLDSPLPSPSLPAVLPRQGKKPLPRWLIRLRRLAVWIGCLVGIFFCLQSTPLFTRLYPATPVAEAGSYEIVESDTLPAVAGPVLVDDERGRARWTVSLPENLDYPLSPAEYRKICSEAEAMAFHLADGKESSGYYHVDKNYIDIDEAKQRDIIPSKLNGRTPRNVADNVVGGEKYLRMRDTMAVCKKSLTFVMQTEDAGLGATLMSLWMSYGLAKKEGRSFFIDDKNWPYGRYTNYFKQPPLPDCQPPPVSHRTPYPHHARHLLVSSATAQWTFGTKFNEQFESPRKVGADRQKEMFKFLRAGYEALFHIDSDDAKYIEQRMAEIRSSIPKGGGPLISIHVRHGDRHPFEFQYEKSYIPLDIYVDAANDLVTSFYNQRSIFSYSINSSSSKKASEAQYRATSSMILASDDPETYSSPEMKGIIKAQSSLSLSSDSPLDGLQEFTEEPSGKSAKIVAKKPPKDSKIDWDGGFFNSIFWSLGDTSLIPSAEGSPSASQGTSSVFPPHRVVRESEYDRLRFNPSAEALRLRELVAKTYLTDLSLLAEGDGVVCAVSSITCRLLAVMLGWNKAIAQGGWKNVDGKMDWIGIV